MWFTSVRQGCIHMHGYKSSDRAKKHEPKLAGELINGANIVYDSH